MIESPFENLPDLVPVTPSKPVRFQFQPEEFVLMRAMVDISVRMLEEQPDGSHRNRVLAGLTSILDRMDDKLDFKPV